MKSFAEKSNRTSVIPPVWCLLLLVSALIIVLQRVFRNNRRLMEALSARVVRPIHRNMSSLCSHVGFSVAELLIIIAAVLVLTLIVLCVCRIIKRGQPIRSILRLFVSFFTLATAVYAGFCVLWGVYYYGESFTENSGIAVQEVSVEQLKTVTECFAMLANEYSDKVNRGEDGAYSADFQEIINKSDEVFCETEKRFPCLSGPAIKVKGVYLSHLLSYTGFTGFFFPFTAEANVNTDVESAYFASTVAHELSHQRGVATEQEANFVAVLASLSYGDPDYVYSAALMAYCYLGNALHDADYDSWAEVYSLLNENVLRDYLAEESYWKQFETPVEDATDVVYESFLYSYDQKLGLKSYGACVDLLVNYYYEDASEFLSK